MDKHNAKNEYLLKKEELLNQIKINPHPRIGLQKKTASNLFRYMHTTHKTKKSISIKNFNHIISIDKTNLILDVEGLTSYETIISHTLQENLLPTVAPELKHITIGGAIVGIGIESTSYRYGFVHDGLIEAEVLLPNGKIIFCNASNEYQDLFYALPNSYGTLGYILRAKIKLYPAKPYVNVRVFSFKEIHSFLENMQATISDRNIDFIEGLIFSEKELYLIIGSLDDQGENIENIYQNIFYKLIPQKKSFFLKTEDYIFRYDPDWFWNIPETFFYNCFRRWSPKSLRNSGFYKKYVDYKNYLLSFLGYSPCVSSHREKLIQDWEVPWDQGGALIKFAITHIDLMGKPWAVVPIIPQIPATLFPLKPQTLYLNLGCYSETRRHPNFPAFYNTQLMDKHCFALGGLKMLYSSTILNEQTFANLYNGDRYQILKNKYDPHHVSSHLYQKVAISP